MDKTEADSGKDGHPLRLYRKAVACREPVIESLIIIIQRVAVAKDAVVYPLMELFSDLIGQLEVHVGYPHRKQIVPATTQAIS